MKTEYELIEYTKDNPIQVGDIFDMGGREWRVDIIGSGDLDGWVSAGCGGLVFSVPKSLIKQGRRPIKKEIVSGAKVCEAKGYENPVFGPQLRLSQEKIIPGKTYFLIEKEDGE